MELESDVFQLHDSGHDTNNASFTLDTKTDWPSDRFPHLLVQMHRFPSRSLHTHTNKKRRKFYTRRISFFCAAASFFIVWILWWCFIIWPEHHHLEPNYWRWTENMGQTHTIGAVYRHTHTQDRMRRCFCFVFGIFSFFLSEGGRPISCWGDDMKREIFSFVSLF